MYFDSEDKSECFGCEACVPKCAHNAISMREDEEGFRYPVIDISLCVECGLCRKVCAYENTPEKYHDEKYVFGGYNNDAEVRFQSTSGGAFSAVAEAFCDENYVIFGAESDGLKVFHSYIDNIDFLGKYRKSKYSQSIIGTTYTDVLRFLLEGKKVLFSGTPCQIAGLRSFLGEKHYDNLLTVEVVCEGVPSPLYVRKLDKYLQDKYGAGLEYLDYRYTGKSILSHGKWDFQQMLIRTVGKDKRTKELVKDRWFNPFWYIWLDHMMSRPSCYKCKFATDERVADITLGDLWGVHLYCPELYGNNGGSSLVVCNTQTGKRVFSVAREKMFGHELAFEDALKYQSPMRKTIDVNPRREEFMKDLESDMDYQSVNRKWARKPSLKLLFQKYIWGNRQKICMWNLKKRSCVKKGNNNA